LKLHWESTGEGEPVLLIAGLALPGTSWWRTVPVLARRFRVLTYDHAGVGRSTSLRAPFSTVSMAAEALGVLDAAGVSRAHVYGTSLGGLVAQQLAARHPDRVRSLVLGATHPGGARTQPPEREIVSFLRRRPTLPAQEAAWSFVPYSYGARCRRLHLDRIAQDIARRLEFPYARAAYRAQLFAGATHDAFLALRRLKMPTLVVHGREDRVIPVANAELLADAIPDAELRLLDESGHVYMTEEPSVDETIASFLEAHA
jgi:pimeloyl-ACP methyl ester carboxylesterase